MPWILRPGLTHNAKNHRMRTGDFYFYNSPDRIPVHFLVILPLTPTGRASTAVRLLVRVQQGHYADLRDAVTRPVEKISRLV